MELLLAALAGFAIGAAGTFVLLSSKHKTLTEQNAKLEAENSLLNQNTSTTDELKELLKAEFKNIANQALLDNQARLQTSSNESLKELLEPMKTRLSEFQQKVEAFNLAEEKNSSMLKEQISGLEQKNLEIEKLTFSLINALRTNQNTKGAYAEGLLEQMLQSSGLLKDVQYSVQESHRDEDMSLLRTDVVVYLPDNRHIVIDSKFAFKSYFDYIDEDDTEEKQRRLKEFKNDVKCQITDLSQKGYQHLNTINSPDFVLMFMPVEASLHLIYTDLGIVKEAMEKNIIIVGPSSLLSTLRIIKHTWTQQNLNEKMKDVGGLMNKVYDKFCTLINKLNEVGSSLHTTQKKLESAFGVLSAGRGNLVGQIKKFEEFGFIPSKDVPKVYLECSSHEQDDEEEEA